ncbi:uncharacterized protein [Periplaneta americana]
MSSLLLTCPLCSQPGFQSLDSLRYGLISAATRQVVCPVCHDILFGLDKFTIHLFSHTIQHNHQETNNILPLQLSTSECNNELNAIPSQSKSIVISSSAIDSNITGMKNNSIERDHTNISVSSNQSNNAPKPKLHNTKEIIPEDGIKISHIEAKQIGKMSSTRRETTEGIPVHQNILCKEETKDRNCKCVSDVQEKKNSVTNRHTSDISERCSTQTSEKSLLTFPKSTKMHNVTLTNSENLKKDCPQYDINTDNIHIQNNVSVQCSELSSMPQQIQEELSTVVQINKTIKEIVRCNICGFAFDDPSILMIHHQLVHSVSSDINTLSHVTKTVNGSKHVRTSDEKHQFSCHLCSKVFKMRGSLMVHLRVVHPNSTATEKSLLGRTDSDSHAEERKFSCHLCSKLFKKEQHLTQHLKTHEGKQWECDVCCKLFTTKYFLKKHKRLHTGETPYSCDTCGKTFTFQQSYHKHLLYHSDDKPHVCTECDRAFKELSTLHNHQRIHTGEKPFACETCGKCFRQRVSYLVHRRIHTGAMPYKCTACGKSFRYKVSQRTHKCPSQPPGTVVRQSGELVKKLLQEAQQKQIPSNLKVLPDQKYVANDERSKTDEDQQSLTTQNMSNESHAQDQHHQYDENQFTIILGSEPIFPSGQILVTSNSLYNSSTSPVHKFFNSVSDSTKATLTTHTENLIDKTGEAVSLPRKIDMYSGQKQQIYTVAMETSGVEKDKQKSGDTLQNRNNNSGDCNVKENEYELPKVTRNCNQNPSSNPVREHETFLTKDDGKYSSLVTGKKLGMNLSLIKEKKLCMSDNCVKSSICNSTDFWKTSHTSEGHSDLVVETTDFFTMVMSPSIKSLPSPSEKLKHLSLSSPVSNLLNYEDDGMYNFLLNSDETAHHNETETKDNTNFSTDNTLKNNNKGVQDCIHTHATNSGVDSVPLQTINEESLKQLLYGSTSS